MSHTPEYKCEKCGETAVGWGAEEEERKTGKVNCKDGVEMVKIRGKKIKDKVVVNGDPE